MDGSSSKLLNIVDELHLTASDVYAEEADRFNDLIAEMRGALGGGKRK